MYLHGVETTAEQGCQPGEICHPVHGTIRVVHGPRLYHHCHPSSKIKLISHMSARSTPFMYAFDSVVWHNMKLCSALWKIASEDDVRITVIIMLFVKRRSVQFYSADWPCRCYQFTMNRQVWNNPSWHFGSSLILQIIAEHEDQWRISRWNIIQVIVCCIINYCLLPVR